MIEDPKFQLDIKRAVDAFEAKNGPIDEYLTEAQVDSIAGRLRSDVLSDHIQKVVAAAPPLSAEQRSVLAGLLGNGYPQRYPQCSPVTPQARPRPTRKVALYRNWDSEGVLLYIGISADPRARRRTHNRHSVWTEFAVREEIEWHTDRETAEAVEKAAIVAEKPLFNGQHTTPEAQVACVEYLLKRGRTDLLRFGGPRG